jgi:CheY-like chemotaxis protein
MMDDDEINLLVLKSYLSKLEGFIIESASNGLKALNIIKENSVNSIHFDLILMDNRMPIMDGLEATKEIKHLVLKDLIPDLPIIASTADQTIEVFDQAGFCAILRKPFSKEALMLEITKCIDLRIDHRWIFKIYNLVLSSRCNTVR